MLPSTADAASTHRRPPIMVKGSGPIRLGPRAQGAGFAGLSTAASTLSPLAVSPSFCFRRPFSYALRHFLTHRAFRRCVSRSRAHLCAPTLQKGAAMEAVLSIGVIAVWILAYRLMREAMRARSPEEALVFQNCMAVLGFAVAALGLLFMVVPHR